MPGFFKRSAILTAASVAMVAIGAAVFGYFQASHLYTEMPFMTNVLAAVFTSLPTVFILAVTLDAIRPERPNEVGNQENHRAARNIDDENRAQEQNRLRALEQAAQALRQQAQEQRVQIENLAQEQRQQRQQLLNLERHQPTGTPERNEQQRLGAATQAAINNASKNSPAPAA